MENLLLSRANENLDSYRHHVGPGVIIFREGETGDTMFLILSGNAGVSKGETNEARLIDTNGPGEIFGETALIAAIPRSATGTALEPTDLMAIENALEITIP